MTVGPHNLLDHGWRSAHGRTGPAIPYGTIASMRRSRTTDVSLGLGVLLVNVVLVVAVVLYFGGRSETPPSASPSSTRSGQAGSPGQAPAAGDATPISQLVPADADLTLAVLGDGTGDEDGEWVSVLTGLLGKDRRATLNNLDPSDPTHYAAGRSYGSGERTATIWNGSRRAATADYAADRLEFLVPKEPNAILLNYGREDTAGEIGSRLDATLAAIRAAWPKVPVAIVLQAQNTDDKIAPVRRAAAVWAEANDLTTIDVAEAFLKAGDPNSFVSILDPPSVNARGGKLWGETVFRALGGRLAGDPTATTSSTSAGAAAPQVDAQGVGGGQIGPPRPAGTVADGTGTGTGGGSQTGTPVPSQTTDTPPTTDPPPEPTQPSATAEPTLPAEPTVPADPTTDPPPPTV